MTHNKYSFFILPLFVWFFNPHTFHILYLETFHVLTAATLKTTVVWRVPPYSLVERYERFGGAPTFTVHPKDGDSILLRTLVKFYHITSQKIVTEQSSGVFL
jgi:hypothetical protein